MFSKKLFLKILNMKVNYFEVTNDRFIFFSKSVKVTKSFKIFPRRFNNIDHLTCQSISLLFFLGQYDSVWIDFRLELRYHSSENLDLRACRLNLISFLIIKYLLNTPTFSYRNCLQICLQKFFLLFQPANLLRLFS